MRHGETEVREQVTRLQALHGLERLAIPAEDLLLALAGDGTPFSPEQFRQRFGQFMAGRLADHDGDRVGISLDW